MPKKPSLEATTKQLELLGFIISYTEENGYQPSQAEMACHFGVTQNAIWERLKGLEHRGEITLPGGRRGRAIGLTGWRFKTRKKGDGR